MLDTGASCHMVRDSSMLIGIKKIPAATIGLPNSAHTLASKMGLASLG